MKVKNKEKQKIEVEIYGQHYTLTSTEASADYILQVAEYVDQKMREISMQVGNKISISQLAILVALNIADELFQQKLRSNDEEIILMKTQQLIQLLDDGIMGDPII